LKEKKLKYGEKPTTVGCTLEKRITKKMDKGRQRLNWSLD